MTLQHNKRGAEKAWRVIMLCALVAFVLLCAGCLYMLTYREWQQSQTIPLLPAPARGIVVDPHPDCSVILLNTGHPFIDAQAEMKRNF